MARTAAMLSVRSSVVYRTEPLWGPAECGLSIRGSTKLFAPAEEEGTFVWFSLPWWGTWYACKTESKPYDSRGPYATAQAQSMLDSTGWTGNRRALWYARNIDGLVSCCVSSSLLVVHERIRQVRIFMYRRPDM